MAPRNRGGANSASSTVSVARTVCLVGVEEGDFVARNRYDKGDAVVVDEAPEDDCVTYALTHAHDAASRPRFLDGRHPFGKVP